MRSMSTTMEVSNMYQVSVFNLALDRYVWICGFSSLAKARAYIKTAVSLDEIRIEHEPSGKVNIVKVRNGRILNVSHHRDNSQGDTQHG